MKIKIFSHNDADGCGCVIVTKHAFDEVDYELCNYGEINEKVYDFALLGKEELYDLVLITDISVDERTAELIASVGRGKYQLIDHHSTADWLNKYPWAEVHEQNERGKTSGTSLLYNWLIKNGWYDGDMLVEDFVELVRRYDSWEWITKYNDQHAKRLNDLLYIIGQAEFIRRFSENADIRFTSSENLILDIEEKKIEKYIKAKEKQMVISTIDEYKVGVIFSEQYVSQLGNELAKKYSELDIIILIDVGATRISYRNVKEEVDVAVFAQKYGGGGHPRSAGSLFSKHLLPIFIREIFYTAEVR